MNRNRYLFAGVALTAAAFVVTAALYPRLPAELPIHWNLRGEADGYGAKQWAAFLLPGLMIGWLLLSRLLPWLSPERFRLEPFWSTYQYVVFIIVAWMGYAQATVLWAALAKVDVGKAVTAGAFLLFALLGNVLGKVRPNFWIGVRTPWTIADERVWTDTHRFAARLYFALGVLGFVAVLAGAPIMWCFLGLMIGLFLPVLYSLLHYKQLTTGGGRGRFLGLTLFLLLVVVLLVGGAGWLLAYASPQSFPPPPDLVRSAQTMIANLSQHKPEAARQDFTAQMRQALPADKLQALWDDLVRTKGAYHGVKGIRAERLTGYRAIYLTTEFGRTQIDFKVVFDQKGKISGLWLVPPQPAGKAVTPPPALTRAAEAVVTSLSQHKPEEARRDFAPSLRQALPAEKLQQGWDALAQQQGPFRGQKGVRAAVVAGTQTVYVTCDFGGSLVNFKAVFDTAGKITGLWIEPAAPQEGK